MRGEGLLRRFDDSNDDHWSAFAIDEGDGSRRLKGGAFIWNPELSVVLTSVLDRLGIAYEEVAAEPYMGLAFACAESVTAFRSGSALTDETPEFEVVADPQAPPPHWKEAHGLVRQAGVYSSKGRAREACRELVRRVFTAILTSSGKTPEWESLFGS